MIAVNVSPTAGNLGACVCGWVGGWMGVILAFFDSFSPLYNRHV